MSISLRMQRAQDLTTVELPTLDAWNEALDNGDLHTADRIAQVGLDLEHFISVVPLDPATMDIATFRELTGLFTLARAQGIPIPHMPNLEDVTPAEPLPVITQGEQSPSPRRAARPKR